MSLDVRVIGLEWILQELDTTKIPHVQVRELVDVYEKHFTAYVNRNGTVGFIAGNLEARRYLQPIIYTINELYKKEGDD